MGTVADLLLARREDRRVGLRFEDAAWTYAAYVEECAKRATYLARLDPNREPHIGVLLENVPDFCFWLGGAALAGATVVGVNPTRRGAELARDIEHTECQFVVTDSEQIGLLDGIDVPVLNVDTEVLPEADEPSANVEENARLLLLFTSGTTAAPNAVI